MKPRILINFACSLDGNIALRGGKAFRFSNFEDLTRVHKMRAESDIILVGKNTINMDNPKLVVNEKYYRSSLVPDVAILDSNLTVDRNARVFSYPRKVIIFCRRGVQRCDFDKDVKSEVVIENSPEKTISPNFVVQRLGELGYRTVMIEGGKSVITSFITDGVWDEITVFYSPILTGEDGISMIGLLKEPLRFQNLETERLGDGILLRIKKEF